MQKRVERSSNIELLRIVLMFMIVIHHLLLYSFGLRNIENGMPINDRIKSLFFVDNFLIIAVNAFVFTSGYFGIKPKFKMVLTLFSQGAFFSLLIHLLISHFYSVPFTKKNIIEDCLSTLIGNWWFLRAYFFFYLLSPIYTIACENFSEQQHKYIVIILTILNALFRNVTELGVIHGYSLFTFSTIYITAQYFRKYPEQKIIGFIIKYPFITLIISYFSNLIILLLNIHRNPSAIFTTVFGYNNPFILLGAVSIFFLFKKLNLKSSIINYIAGGCFGAYLLNDDFLIRYNINVPLFNILHIASFNQQIFTVLIFSLVTLIMGILLEKIRGYLINPIINFVYIKFRLEKFDRFLAVNP